MVAVGESASLGWPSRCWACPTWPPSVSDSGRGRCSTTPTGYHPDSTGALIGTTDDRETWEPTRSLPRELTKHAGEVCLASGDCYRIRSDRLAIETAEGESWTTVGEYPTGRVSYLGRQLPRPCGDGHGDPDLKGMAPTDAGSSWQFVVAAGPDGVLAIGDDGEWVLDSWRRRSLRAVCSRSR